MKAYVKPTMEMEIFAANEVVAACGESGTVYNFTCNAGRFAGLTGYSVYYADGTEMGDYAPCSATHEADSDDVFVFGCYMQKNILGVPAGDKIPVTVWRGRSGSNIHCTVTLNKEDWETAKS